MVRRGKLFKKLWNTICWEAASGRGRRRRDRPYARKRRRSRLAAVVPSIAWLTEGACAVASVAGHGIVWPVPIVVGLPSS